MQNQPSQARMKANTTGTPTLRMKLQEILAELHQVCKSSIAIWPLMHSFKAKTNQEVTHIMLTLYNATVTNEKPSDSLALSLWDSLKV
jgi:hypothetical protein